MSEPAALDLAAIMARQRGAVSSRLEPAFAFQMCERDIPALVDELERCRAERDALRAALESVAKRPWEPTDPTSVVAALLTAQTAARAALGEVTP